LNQNQSEHELSVRKYAIVVREQTASEFDQANAATLDQTLQDIGKVLAFKSIAVMKGGDIGTGARFHAFALTKTAMDVLVSALQMARQRARVETLALLRVALETACTSRHIYKDEAAYKLYVAGKYKSTRSIAPAKEEISIIGEVYGAFSNTCVHTTHSVSGPRYRVDRDGTVAPTVELNFRNTRPHTPRQDAMLLTLVSLLAMILLKILENNTIDMGVPDKSERRHEVDATLHYYHATDARIQHYYNELLKYADR